MVICLREWRNQRKRMTRNGRIARLPAALREELNQRLLDGEQGQPWIEWLNGQPKVQAVLQAKFNGNPITENNLPMNPHRKRNLLSPTLSSTSMWRRGGWNGAHGLMGSMCECFRGNLSQIDQTKHPKPAQKKKARQLDAGREKGADQADSWHRPRLRWLDKPGIDPPARASGRSRYRPVQVRYK